MKALTKIPHLPMFRSIAGVCRSVRFAFRGSLRERAIRARPGPYTVPSLWLRDP